MSYRQFATGFFIIVTLFVLLNAVVRGLFTRDIFSRNDGIITGDIARIGYISDLVHPRRNRTNLPRTHLESGDYHGQHIDLLTIGDSFSQGAGGGLNRYYQDHIATELGWTVLNLQRHPDSRNDLETIAALANSGFLQRTGVHYVLLEATQRRAVRRLSTRVDMDLHIAATAIDDYYRFGDSSPDSFNFSLPDVSFINNGNFKFLLYRLLYPFHDCALASATCRTTIKSPRFSIGNGREMLFYKKDVREIKHHTLKLIQKMNENLDAFATRLESLGISLLFMPAVSKYDLYRDDFIDDSYPRDPFFDLLRKQQRNYLLVDTRAILAEGLRNGELDIFYVDDTHWRPRASQLIAQALRDMVSNQD